MHELSLLADLFRKLDEIAARENASRIASVHIRIGALAHISADHLKEHFVEGADGGICENAALVIDEDTNINDPHANEIMLVSAEVERNSE